MTSTSRGAGRTGGSLPARWPVASTDPPPSSYVVPMSATYSTEAVVAGLPAAQELIDAARHAGDQAGPLLDRYKPVIDEYADQETIARFLGYAYGDVVRRKRYRTRRDGTLDWPEPDKVFGRSPVWTWRTVILHLAAAPGQGHPGYTGGRDWDRASLRTSRNSNVMPVADGLTLPPGAASALRRG